METSRLQYLISMHIHRVSKYNDKYTIFINQLTSGDKEANGDKYGFNHVPWTRLITSLGLSAALSAYKPFPRDLIIV